MEKTKLSKYLNKCHQFQHKILNEHPELTCYVNVFNFGDGVSLVNLTLFDRKGEHEHLNYYAGTNDWYTEDESERAFTEFLIKAKEVYGV